MHEQPVYCKTQLASFVSSKFLQRGSHFFMGLFEGTPFREFLRARTVSQLDKTIPGLLRS